MSIRTKITILVVALFALSASVDFLVQRFIIYPSFLRLEQQETGENIRRVVGAIDREIFHLDKLCSDWATWNESYDFIETLSDDYILDNLIVDTFVNNKVNLICYFNHDGTVVWGQAYDLENGTPLRLPFLKSRTLPASHPMVELKADPAGNFNRVRTGVIMTDAGPMMFASRAILRSDSSGPSRGVLTMGRLFNDALIASLVNQTRIHFSIDYPLTAETIRQEKAARSACEEKDLTFYARRERQHINVWTVYHDPRGEAAFSILYRFPREITQKGLASIRYALALGVGTALTVLTLLFVFLQSMVVQPIKQLTDHASRLDHEGDFSTPLNLRRRDELGQLARVFDFTAATIAERTDALKIANQELQKLSRIDELTGIANRRMFDDHLKKEWQRAVRHKSALSLIILDVDHFKQFNDMYGHQEGDRCLAVIAAAIDREATRPADLVARYGGEEFAVILPDTDAQGAFHVAENIREAIADLNIVHQGSETAGFVTISLGVNRIAPAAADSMASFIQKTDQALYTAKREGRNRAVISK